MTAAALNYRYPNGRVDLDIVAIGGFYPTAVSPGIKVIFEIPPATAPHLDAYAFSVRSSPSNPENLRQQTGGFR
jgi:hypothetical protein